MFKKFTLLCSALACTMMLAQHPAGAASSDVQAVETVVEKLRVAMVGADLKQLEALSAKELSYGHSDGRVQNQAEFIDEIKTGATFVNMKLLDQTVKVVGDSAVVRHTLDTDLNNAGKTIHVTIKVLLVWQKHDGHWLLLARQAVRPA